MIQYFEWLGEQIVTKHQMNLIDRSQDIINSAHGKAPESEMSSFESDSNLNESVTF